MLLELDGSDNVIRKYTWGLDLAGQSGGRTSGLSSLESAGGIGGLLAVHDAGESQDYLYLYDANGNVGQVLDWDATTLNDALVAHYEYDPYGNLTASDGDYADENPIRFSTKYWDDESGLGYWGYRYYSPALGRWINRDPIGERGGPHLYGYVQNRPIDRRDPLGRTWLLDPGAPAQKQACCQYTATYRTAGAHGKPLPPVSRKYQRTESCPQSAKTPAQCCKCACTKARFNTVIARSLDGATWGPCCSCRVETRRENKRWLIGNWPRHLALFVKCSDGAKWTFQFPTIGYHDDEGLSDETWTVQNTGVVTSYCVSCDTAEQLRRRAQSFPMDTKFVVFWTDCYWAVNKILREQRAALWVSSDNCPEVKNATNAQ